MERFTLANKPIHAGRMRIVHIGNVSYRVDWIPYGEPSDIVFQFYKKGCRGLNSRPFITKRAGYKTLEAAVRSLISSRN